MKPLRALILAVALLSGTVANAQDFNKGLEAYLSEDFQTSLSEMLPLAEHGHAQAQAYLGFMYENGQGVPQDYAEAVKWVRLAADQGHAEAQQHLGYMHHFGHGVLEDYVIAHMWYNIASANGDPNAANMKAVVKSLITSADILEAQAMARECMSSGYENCGR